MQSTSDSGYINITDQFILWEQLSENEKVSMFKRFVDKPEPISSEEKHKWIMNYQDISLSSDAYIPFRDNIDRAGRTNI